MLSASLSFSRNLTTVKVLIVIGQLYYCQRVAHPPYLTVIKIMSASTVANTNPNEREINPMHLSLEQLNNLKTQNEEELQELQRQLEALHNAKSRFMNARNTLDDISTSVLNDVLLVPLNSSLYVPGKIVDPEKV